MRDDHIKQIKEGNSQTFYMSYVWRKKRLEILERDNYECRRCRELGKVTTTNEILEVHHIKELDKHPELGLDNDNLITLCKSCHNYYHERFGDQKSRGEKMGIPERW